MTNSKSTKRSLLISSMSLLLCFAMLLGTTFAWFTDSVTSAGNKIVAGNLDVQLLMDIDKDGEYETEISEISEPIFGSDNSIIAQDKNADTLWEPGKTQVAYLAIKNNGNLALKYTVDLEVENVKNDLYEVMEYDIIENAKFGEVSDWISGNGVVEGVQAVSDKAVELPVGATHYFALAIHMKEEAGNEYQNGQVNFDLTVYATQQTHESDSFNDQYDADAEYYKPAPTVKVTNAEELITALNNVTEEVVIDAKFTATMSELGTVAGSYTTWNLNAGTTIKGLTLTFDKSNCGIMTHNGVLNGGQIIFEECKFLSVNNFNGTVQTQSGQDAAGTKLVFNNCTFAAAKSIFADNTGGGVEFNNCKFNKVDSGYGLVQCMGGNQVFNSCEFDITDSMSFGSSSITKYGHLNLYSENYNTTVTAKGCTNVPPVHNYKYGSGNGQFTNQ